MPAAPTDNPTHACFDGASLSARQARSGLAYLEFLRTPTMSIGLYALEPGQPDNQKPHTEDEAYVVLRGAARFSSAGEDRAVRPGDVLYVRRGVEHRFHSITERLEVAVVFAPPEGSLGPGSHA